MLCEDGCALEVLSLMEVLKSDCFVNLSNNIHAIHSIVSHGWSRHQLPRLFLCALFLGLNITFSSAVDVDLKMYGNICCVVAQWWLSHVLLYEKRLRHKQPWCMHTCIHSSSSVIKSSIGLKSSSLSVVSLSDSCILLSSCVSLPKHFKVYIQSYG